MNNGEYNPMIIGGAKHKILGINIHGIGMFEPQEDITALEVAHLMNMFMTAMTANALPDFDEYVKRNNLTRHFQQQK